MLVLLGARIFHESYYTIYVKLDIHMNMVFLTMYLHLDLYIWTIFQNPSYAYKFKSLVT
jgi:hypothetical protein